jgi:hypothetical protein
MKYRYPYLLLAAAVLGLMIWGCSGDTADPVSSTGASSTGGGIAKVLGKTVASPANVVATVTGSNVTITWDSVSLAVNYHVVILANGNPYIDSIFYAQQLVLTNVASGSYAVTVAAILSGLAEGTASTPVTFTLSSVVAPTVTATALPVPFCFRNGEWVTVTFSGLVVNSQGGASYELTDEYNQVHYTGTVAAGLYSVRLKLKDRSIWYDRDGRQYTFTITATNSAGTATASVTVTVPRDRNCPNSRFDDGWDRGW